MDGKKRITRSRRGCLTCRSRKVKCDEAPGQCATCQKLGIACKWPSGTPVRDSLACAECRQSRTGCDKARPSCSRCTTRGQVCVYGGPVEVEDEIESGAKRLVDLYLLHVYPIRMNAFIQRGELFQELRENGRRSLVIRAICAAAYRYSETADTAHPDGGEQARRWAQSVLRELSDRLNEISEETLCATLIMSEHEMASGRYVSAWTHVGTIARMVFAMRLNVQGPDHDNTAMETRHRLFWAAFVSDCFQCGGIPEYTLIKSAHVHIPLPIPNHAFNLGTSTSRYFLDDTRHMSPGEDSIISRYIRLMAIRRDILHATKYLEHGVKPWDPGSRWDGCLLQLRQWYDTLPTELRHSRNALFAYHGTGELTSFASLHLWYEQLHCDLYRIAFPGFRESPPPTYLEHTAWIDNARQAAYTHACAIVEQLRLLLDDFPEISLHGMDMAVFAHESIRIQLQYLRLVHGPTHPPDVVDSASKRFDTLVKLVRSMSRYHYAARRWLRDLDRLLLRHGYSVISWDTDILGTQSIPGTPVAASAGPVLSNMHSLARHDGYGNGRIGTKRYDITSGQPLSALPVATRSTTVRFAAPIAESHTGSSSGADLFEIDSIFNQYAQPDIFSDINPFLSIFEPWTAEGLDEGM